MASSKEDLTDMRYLANEEYECALDAGCGTGRNATELSEVAEKIFAFDIDRENIKAFRDRGVPETHELFVASATDIPFPDETFDLVVSYTVYEHIPKDQIGQYLSELYRVLAAGGTAYIVNDTLMYRILRRLRIKMAARGPDPTHINMVTPSQMAENIRKAGFEIDEFHCTPFDGFFPSKLDNRLGSPFATKGRILATK